MVHTGGTIRENGYQNLIRYRAVVVAEELAMLMEERRVTAGVHGLHMVVDKCLFGGRGRRDVEVESGMAEKRFWRAGGWPTKLFQGRWFADVDICKHT
jgi:hypothetical protein